jgi:hypothetical protein
MPSEAAVELHGLVTLPSVAEADDENLLVCACVESEGPASVLVDEGCRLA